jgi:LacI family transcriptional regulator
MDQVAQHAGVSVMTVSRVMNNVPGVKKTTREVVMRAVKELGYSPNAAARSLARHGSGRVGLLYSNPSAGYLSEILVGALDEAQRSGALLVIEKCDLSLESEKAAIGRLVSGGVAGVILPAPHADSQPAIAELQDHGVIAVAVGTGRSRSDANVVRMDDFAAAADMTRHLLELGHRRIGFVKGAENQTVSMERLLGFEHEIRNTEPAATALIEPGNFTYRSGFEAAERLLSDPQPPTAIFASNDDMAAGVVAAAHRRGLDVPGDLSVAGFDDTHIATAVWPELTTVRQPVARMAEAALRIVLDESRSGRDRARDGKPVDRMLPHELIVRTSSGQVPVRN